MSKSQKSSAPDQALLERRRRVGLIIQSLVLLIVILGYWYITAQKYVIDCKKDQGVMINCTLRNTVLGLLTLEKRTLTGMVAAQVTEQCQADVCQYRLELYDNLGVAYPVSQQYSPNAAVEQRVAVILNHFVTNPKKLDISLREQVDLQVFILPITAIAAFVLYRLSLGKPK